MSRRFPLEHRPSQTGRIVGLLRDRSPNWVPLTDILAVRISQYAARIFQARHQWALNIENKIEIVNGKKHSWFRLIEAFNGTSLLPKPNRADREQSAAPSLFQEVEMERSERWEDHG